MEKGNDNVKCGVGLDRFAFFKSILHYHTVISKFNFHLFDFYPFICTTLEKALALALAVLNESWLSKRKNWKVKRRNRSDLHEESFRAII